MMTRKEAREYLNNKKVYVNGKSKEIQEKLFSLGFTWKSGSTEVHCTYSPFLYIENDTFMCGDNMRNFAECEKAEVSADYLLYMYVTEVRPFANYKECMRVLKGKSPYFTVINSNKRYCVIMEVFEDGVAVAIAGESRTLFYSYNRALDELSFITGTPFGITE